MSSIFQNDNGYQFINLRDYVEEYFKDHVIRIVKERSIILSELTERSWDYFVKVSDYTTEWNLRLIESRMPETLYYLMQHSSRKTSIRNRVKNVCKKNRQSLPWLRPRLLLEIRMYQLFEAVLYMGYEDGKLKGLWLTDRCYAIKRNGELEFYTLYDRNKLIKNLVDWLAFAPIKFIEDGKLGYELRFEFIV